MNQLLRETLLDIKRRSNDFFSGKAKDAKSAGLALMEIEIICNRALTHPAIAQPAEGGEVVGFVVREPQAGFADRLIGILKKPLPVGANLYTTPPASQGQAIEITRLKAEIERLEAIKRVSIPTPAMEQEYQWHWRQGYEAGKKASQEQAQQPQAQDLKPYEKDCATCGNQELSAYSNTCRSCSRRADGSRANWTPQTQAQELPAIYLALSELLGVLNQDKDGGYFICAEAEDIVERAIAALAAKQIPSDTQIDAIFKEVLIHETCDNDFRESVRKILASK